MPYAPSGRNKTTKRRMYNLNKAVLPKNADELRGPRTS
jgi:hypothetical protein